MLNYLLLALVPLAFGANPVIARALVGVFEPATLTFLRWSLSALIIGSIAISRGRSERWSTNPRTMIEIMLLGIVGMGFCAYAAFEGVKTATATTVGLIYASTAALVAAWEIVRGRERATLPLLTGLVLCLTGVSALLTKGDLLSITELRIGTGELWAIAGTLGWVGYTIALRGRGQALTPLALFAVMSVAASVAAMPIMLVEIAETPPPRLDSIYGVWIAALVLVTGVGAFLGYNLSVTRNGPILTAASIALTPLYIAGMAVVLLGEAVHWYHALAIALVTTGLAFVNWSRLRKPKV